MTIQNEVSEFWLPTYDTCILTDNQFVGQSEYLGWSLNLMFMNTYGQYLKRIYAFLDSIIWLDILFANAVLGQNVSISFPVQLQLSGIHHSNPLISFIFIPLLVVFYIVIHNVNIHASWLLTILQILTTFKLGQTKENHDRVVSKYGNYFHLENRFYSST